jgi:hypothetical protein
MYKDLSKYAEIANSIKPDLADIKVDDDIVYEATVEKVLSAIDKKLG